MSRLGLVCLCVCAVSSLAYGRAVRRGEKPAGSKLMQTTEKPEPHDSIIPGQCQVNGMSLFDGAMWSTQPCSLCQCRRGIVSCQAVVPRGGSNNPQPRAPKAKRLDDSKVDKAEAAEQRSGLQSNGGTRVQEVKRIPAEPLPRSVRDKPVAAKKKKQDLQRDRTAVKRVAVPVVVKMPVRAPVVPAVMTPIFSFPESHEDSREFDDDFDDDIVGPPPRVQVMARPTLRPIPKPRVTMARTAIPPPVAPGRPVVTFPQTPSFMESLPAGCLLSDSLIACGGTGMTHMPIIKDLGVRTLYLADNRISKIPARALAGLPNLEWLDLSKNKLTDASLSPGLFQNLTKLRRLILDGNNLTKVPMFLPSSLVELKINDNKLSGLTPSSFKGLSKLLTLELEDNYFHDGNVSPLTFRPLRKLMYLRLEDNKFRAIPSGLPTSLQALHLSDNKIEVVHAGILNKTLNLRVLDLSHNRIREDRIAPRAWIHLLKLESLDLSHNKLVHAPSFLPTGVRQLTLHHNQIERIPGYVFAHLHPGLDSLHLSHNRLRDDGIDGVSFIGLSASLSELLLDHNHLRSIPRGLLQLKNLQHLRLNNNLISYVPMNSLCDTHATEDSPLISVHLQYNLIQRRLIPPTAFSCIRNYHSVLLRPQSHDDDYDE